jgi:hypothetical protein
MSKRPGKKIGTLEVKLDRQKTRSEWASVKVELRFEITHGTFHAQYEGDWYSAKTKDALSEQIKTAATKALSIEWKRYIQIDYEARGWPIEDEKSGRPATSGQYHTYELDDDRTKFDATTARANDKHAICAIELHWALCEISEPYALPEAPSKRVRAQRRVSIHKWGPDMGKEQICETQEWENDVLPRGILPWTPEREAVLADIVAALGKLDARLLELFTGDVEVLAGKIDAAAQTDPSRLLTAPAETAPTKRKRA